MKPEIAIIVPAYRATDFISNLIKTIAEQTISDIIKVFITVDGDGFNYNFLKELYPHLNMDIDYLENNQGPGIARNNSLEKVIAEKIPYIVFADADDEFYGKYSLLFLYHFIRSDINTDLVYTPILTEGKQKNSLYLLRDQHDGFLFGKIYKTKLIKEYNIKFFPLYNEDGCFNLQYYICSKEKFNCDIPLYLWKFNNNSICRTDNSIHVTNSYYKDFDHLFDSFKQMYNNPKYDKQAILISIPGNLIRKYWYCLDIREEISEKEFENRKLYVKTIYNKLLILFPELNNKYLWQNYSPKDLNWKDVWEFVTTRSNYD